MADEVSFSTILAAQKGEKLLPNFERTGTMDMLGNHLGTVVQTITEAADVAIEIPSGIAGQYHLEVFNDDPKGGNFLQLSNGTGGAFAAGVFAIVTAHGLPFVGTRPAGATYAKADTADVLIQFRACAV